MVHVVACVRRRDDRPPSGNVYLSDKYKETRNSYLLSVEKRKWESPPSILVTRNPN